MFRVFAAFYFVFGCFSLLFSLLSLSLPPNCFEAIELRIQIKIQANWKKAKIKTDATTTANELWFDFEWRREVSEAKKKCQALHTKCFALCNCHIVSIRCTAEMKESKSVSSVLHCVWGHLSLAILCRSNRTKIIKHTRLCMLRDRRHKISEGHLNTFAATWNGS